MATTYGILSDIKDELSDIEGVVTCRIGIEDDISPADYPLIRIVPERSEHGDSSFIRTKVECWVYVGVGLDEADDGGLEGVYEALDTLEAAVRAKMESASTFTGSWIETLHSDETIEGGYRLLASKYRCVA